MRNAMICVSFVLAIFLAWPMAFGTNGNKMPTTAEARHAVKKAIASVPSVHVIPQALAASLPAPRARPESCYQRFQREVKQCTEGSGSAGCRLGAADRWDMCESTGFWPN